LAAPTGSSAQHLEGTMHGSQLSLVNLRFRDAAAENAYRAASSANLANVDCRLCWHKLWVSVLLLVPILTWHIQSSPLGKGLWVANTCLLLAQLGLLRLAPKVRWHRVPRWRCPSSCQLLCPRLCSTD
jgi:hypothetical protein